MLHIKELLISDDLEHPEPGDAPKNEAEAEPTAKPSRLKKIIKQLLIIVIFLFVVFVGLLVLLYPSVSNYVNTKNASIAIENYNNTLHELSEVDYSDYLAAAIDYNAWLSGMDINLDAEPGANWSGVDRTKEYWDLLDVSDTGMMGYVEIKQLNIQLPIYHGVDEIVLTIGAGHMPGTSLPVGGESTHAVISAHTGLPSAKLFTGIDTMALGDTFALHVLNETLTYQVDQILTVLPEEVEALDIIRGEDHVTLITCTPYGINTHRLLVRGTRIETPPEETPQVTEEAEAEELSLLQALWQKFIAFLVDKTAEVVFNITEWGMNLLGIDY